MTHHDTDPEIAADFERWMAETRLLGRDRMVAAFRAGWAYGFATGVDRALEQHQHTEDGDK